MTDGPTEITEPERTAQDEALVERLVQEIPIDGDLSRLAGFLDGDTYAQHSPAIADNPSGLGSALATLTEQGLTIAYTRRHRTVVDGRIVFTQSEGTLGHTPTAFSDLFRVQDAAMAEHWDVVFAIPETMPHRNGVS